MLNALLEFDHHLFVFLNTHHAPFFDWFFWFVTQGGTGWVVAPIVIGFILKKVPRSNVRNVILCAIIASVVSGLVTTQLKRWINRPRPVLYFQHNPYLPRRAESAPDDFPSEALFDSIAVHIVGPPLRKHSFPSGHTATAFTGAAILVYLFGGWFWISLGVAGLVAYSRIYMGVHFPLDTLGGCMLALVIVWTTLFICSRQGLIPRRGRLKHDRR